MIYMFTIYQMTLALSLKVNINGVYSLFTLLFVEQLTLDLRAGLVELNSHL